MHSTTNREVRAYTEAANYVVMPKSIEGNDWWLMKQDGTTYTVDLAAKTCTCADFRKRRVACKHQALAAFHAEAELPAEERIPVEEAEAEGPSLDDELRFGDQDEDRCQRLAQARRERDLLWPTD